MKNGNEMNEVFLALVLDELLPIMFDNRIRWFTLTKTPLFALSIECMNFLECR